MSGFFKKAIKELLHHVIGSEQPGIQINGAKSFWGKLAENITKSHFKTTLLFLFPKFFCSATLLFVLLLANLVITEVVVYFVGGLTSQFAGFLIARDSNGFRSLALRSISLIIVNATLKSLNVYFANLLSIVWRKYITLKVHDLYFNHKRYYYIHHPQAKVATETSQSSSVTLEIGESNSSLGTNLSKNRRRVAPDISASVNSQSPMLDPEPIRARDTKWTEYSLLEIDNPDQRIAQDIKSLTSSMSTMLPLILITPFLIAWYGYQAYTTVGYSAPLSVFVYFLVWSIINGPFAAPIARIIYKQDRLEGDFRYKHMNLRGNAETIAFYNSGPYELAKANKKLDDLIGISFRRNWQEMILQTLVMISQYLGGIVAYLLLAIPVFFGTFDNLTPSELSNQINTFSFKCQYLIYLFTQLYNVLDDMSSVLGNSRRIGELALSLKYDQVGLRKKPSESEDTTSYFEFKNLSVKTPSGKVLIKEVNFKVDPGQNILITGRSGCGKTSLFRCINGLWSTYTGEIWLKQNLKIFFLPQVAYFTNGSLLQQIVYPSLEYSNQILSLNQIAYWLEKLNLEHLVKLVNDDFEKEPNFEWSNVLSPGEKQRLSFMRIIYHKPQFALLDEFTSSVDQETEQFMYETLVQMGCNFISIAHRDTVRQFHSMELRFIGDGQYAFNPINHVQK